MKVASQVLYNVIKNITYEHKRKKKSLSEARQLLSQELIDCATTVTSNLIEAASLAVQRCDSTVSLQQCNIVLNSTLSSIVLFLPFKRISYVIILS